MFSLEKGQQFHVFISTTQKNQFVVKSFFYDKDIFRKSNKNRKKNNKKNEGKIEMRIVVMWASAVVFKCQQSCVKRFDRQNICCTYGRPQMYHTHKSAQLKIEMKEEGFKSALRQSQTKINSSCTE